MTLTFQSTSALVVNSIPHCLPIVLGLLIPHGSNPSVTRTGWDMDPFVVISFGKKVFRTRVIRHSRNPVWDEKLLFHVRRCVP